MFAYMPMLVLTSKLVPKGLEATTYALLAGQHPANIRYYTSSSQASAPLLYALLVGDILHHSRHLRPPRRPSSPPLYALLSPPP